MTIQDLFPFNQLQATRNATLAEWVSEISAQLSSKGQALVIEAFEFDSIYMIGALSFLLSVAKIGSEKFYLTYTHYQIWKEQAGLTVAQAADQLVAALKEYNGV